jgi:hypothetical protein
VDAIIPWATVELIGELYDAEWWADYEAAVAAADPDPLDEDDPLRIKYERYERAILEATWLMRSLSGGAVHGAETWEDDYRRLSRELHLRHKPVDTVANVWSIEDCGETLTALTGWCHEGAGRYRGEGRVACLSAVPRVDRRQQVQAARARSDDQSSGRQLDDARPADVPVEWPHRCRAHRRVAQRRSLGRSAGSAH